MSKQQGNNRPLTTVLVANRGEIACRLIVGIKQAGLIAVALYSDVDANAPHVMMADKAIHLPGETAAETYLNQQLILDKCARHGVDGLHPGYGFLSENAGFAKACKAAGITFIGPTPEVIEAMGDKIKAKQALAGADVPMLPSIELTDGQPVDTATVEHMGYPVLVKAAAGGGGKGMRRVDSPDKLTDAVAAAQREAMNAFGDGRVFIEKYITKPRHVEVQIIGDEHGNVLHVWERECSIQRRHQKIIEEAPSPTIDQSTREKLCQAAVSAAKALNYTNAGTVEFIVDQSGDFYFLEVNTRLQVEHPITEATTGLDLVALQLAIAQGLPLPVKQAEIQQSGHAIECRLYAEDPDNNYLPSIGTLSHCHFPHVPNLRIDSGVVAGQAVTIHYDPMLAKLIASGPTRQAALATMNLALGETAITGVTTNLGFLKSVINHSAFVAGELHTHFLDEHSITLPEIGEHLKAIALLAEALPEKTGLRSHTNTSEASLPTLAETLTQLAPEFRLVEV